MLKIQEHTHTHMIDQKLARQTSYLKDAELIGIIIHK
jgi:hypothetical protein